MKAIRKMTAFMLTAVMILCCGGAWAEEIEWDMETTFEEFRAAMGVPYSGQWYSFDGAFSVFLPDSLEQRSPSEANVLAEYDDSLPDGQPYRLRIMKIGNQGVLPDREKEKAASAGELYWFKANGVPIQLLTEEDELSLALAIENHGLYSLVMSFPDAPPENNQFSGAYIFSMMFSVTALAEGVPPDSPADSPARLEEKTDSFAESAKANLSSFRIECGFSEEQPKNLEQINRILAAMELTSLSLEDEDIYLRPVSNPDGNDTGIEWDAGFTKVTLVCEKEGNIPGRHYQIESWVQEAPGDFDERTLIEAWQREHPGRRIDTVLIQYSENQCACFFVCYSR